MDLNDLVKAFEEKFGVSAAAMAAPAAGGAAAGALLLKSKPSSTWFWRSWRKQSWRH
jgi:ribosomal protein L7/L12